ncbi:MAG: restriction endonuclease subunit S [Nostocales cyanobacterium 94392]|nr:restriction endonuclease subunit S [Nostocales cyanobacterium 94392]
MSKKINKNVPKLRFPEFEGDWGKKSLQEISVNGFSNGVFNDPQKVGSGYRLINVKDMYSGDSIDVESLTKLELDEKEFLKNKAEYGDIFFTRSSLVKEGIAYSNVLLEKAEDITYDGHLIKLSPNQSSYLPELIALVLKTDTSRRQFVARGKTGTMTTIGQDDVATVKIFCPSLKEQEKIASFFGSVDRRLTQLRRKQELLQTYKRGVMQKIFSQEIRFKRDDGKPFPDWQKKKLGEIASRQVKKNLDKSITRVLTNSAVQGVVDQQDYFDKDIANADNLAGYYIIEKGDYVYNPRISTSAPVGPIHKNKIGLGVMSPLYTVFRFKTEEDAFYEQLFKTSVWHKYMCSVANYGARYDRMNITTSDFMALPLPYPISEEQEKIVDFLTAIDRKIETLSRQIEQTEKFKKCLLQKLFV